MKRRGILKAGALTVVLAPIAVTAASALQKNTPTEGEELLSMGPHHLTVLTALAAQIVTAPRRNPLQIALKVDNALSFSTQRTRDDIKLALSLVENGGFGLLTRFSPTLFSERSPSEQKKSIAALSNSRFVLLRSAIDGIRKLCTAAYFSDEKAAKFLGYPGAPFQKPAPPAILARKALSPPFVVSSNEAASDD